MKTLLESQRVKHKAKSRRALLRFERAVEVFAFKGTCHPDDHEAIEAEYQAARKGILAHMNKVML